MNSTRSSNSFYTDDEKEALAFTCPRCHREPGDRCVGPNGERRPIHQVRVDLTDSPNKIRNIALVRTKITQLLKMHHPSDPIIVMWQTYLQELLEEQNLD